MKDPSKRELRGRLIAALAAKLTDLDVDFRGLVVVEHEDNWLIIVEYDPTSADRLETYQHAINYGSLLAHFTPMVHMIGKTMEAQRTEWLKTQK